jgi:hypothetical protein
VKESNPFRCFDGRYLLETAVAAAAVVALAFVARGFERGSVPRVAVGVAQGAAFAFVLARSLLAIRKLDEMLQRIHLVGIAISFGITGAAVSIAGFVGDAGARVTDLGLWTWILMLVAWGLAVEVMSRRYR